MGLFASVCASFECPSCRHSGDREVQFKFGDVWLPRYRIGDELRWDEREGAPRRRTNRGRRVDEQVLVTGRCDPCPSCGFAHGEAIVVIEGNRIVRVDPPTLDPRVLTQLLDM